MKIALAQINPTIADFAANSAVMARMADDARRRGCDLVIFPELALSGYPPQDLLEKDDFIAANLAALEHLMATVAGIGVITGFVDRNPEDGGKPLFNAAVLFENGRELHRCHKRLLPTYDVFDESRYFESGRACAVCTYKGRRLGLTICEDVWNDPDFFRRRIYSRDPVAAMAAAGADLIVNVSASPFHVGKRDFRLRMLAGMARKYGLAVAHVNQVGGNDGLVFDGISAAFDTTGALAARGGDFEEDLVVWDTDAPAASGTLHPIAPGDTESVLKALETGSRDYVHKCGFRQVVIGLSGGIDSAVTAAVAVRALGPANVRGVFMPSVYTSPDNYADTAQLARNLGIGYEVIPIDAMFREFLKPLAPAFDPAAPGITEQNLQARIRGTILMAISNRDGALVLSTGNKSELAVGYCTLYGDMNGGLAVISDVPKTMVYELADCINAEAAAIPRRIIDKAPSAELAPDQADEDELPPYRILDAILRGSVEESKSAAQLVAEGFEAAVVQDVLARVARAEYKRQQAAPGIKVTSKAFGSGRRYPIAKRFRPLTADPPA
jgi:NAD+ synthase (glutamine-hydrolysing)